MSSRSGAADETAKARGGLETARLIAVAAAIEIGLGLGFYTFPRGFASSLEGLARTLVASIITGGGIMLLLLIRYPLPVWARRLMVLPSVLTLIFGVTHTVQEGSAVRTIHDSLLAAALLAAMARPTTATDAPGQTRPPDLAVGTLAAINALVGLALLRQWVLGIAATTSASASATASAAAWLVSPAGLPGLPCSPGLAGLAGLAGLLGAVYLVLPGDGGAWLQPRGWAGRLAGAALPLFAAITFLSVGDLHGLFWLFWAVAVLGMGGRRTSLSRLMVARAPWGAGAGQAAAGQLPAMDAHLELWTWLVALALLVWTALQGVDGLAPLGTEQFLVLALVAYNLLVHWVWPKLWTPEHRIHAHVAFLTLVIGSLRLVARDSVIAHAFGALLLAMPALATRGLGKASGHRILAIAVALVNISTLKCWLFNGTPPATALAQAVVETLALVLAGGVGVKNADEQRRLVQDLTTQARDLQKAKDTLRESEERFRSAFAHAAIGKALVSPADGRFLAVNRALCEMLGYSEEELLGMSDDAILHPEEQATGGFRLVAMDLTASPSVSAERRYLNRQGQVVWAQVTASPAIGSDGRPQCLIVEIQDISDRKRVEAQLVHLASHDPLTGLLNRRRFREDLARQLEPAEDGCGEGALIFLDIDRFKEVNDTLGHDAGDQVLVDLAGTLRTKLRKADVLARLGGDEFAILLPSAGLEQAEAVAKKVLGSVAGQVSSAGGQRVKITVSLGVAAYPQHGRTPEDLLKRADIALFQAKEFRNCHAVYRPDSPLEALAMAQQVWEKRVREALRERRLIFHAQPILDLRTNRVSHHELLLRMIDRDGKLIPPGAFLGAAERSGLIGEIDRWAVRQAVRLLARAAGSGHHRGSLEVNLSARAFTDDGLIPLIRQELAETGIDPGLLVMEITETAAIANITEARDFITRLKADGVRFALDDFGTGYSSLAHLKNLPVDFLKIDGSFVQDIARNQVDRQLVAGIAGMAHGMGLETVAEFVGSPETLAVVRGLGVDHAQGFYIGVPQDLAAVHLEEGPSPIEDRRALVASPGDTD